MTRLSSLWATVSKKSGPNAPAPPPGTVNTYNYTGTEQSVTMPSTGNLTVHLIGAAGGQGVFSDGAGGSGAGGYTTITFAVTAGDVIALGCGGGGVKGAATTGGLGGWPGGGSGSFGDTFCGGGGGYSYIKKNGVMAAIAGGGGGGTGWDVNGGAGGGSTGQASGTNNGGTQSAGGSNSGNRQNGSSLQGGNADLGNRTVSTVNDDGGGGGGLFGGASGFGDGSAGAGGSGYVNTALSGFVSGSTFAGNQTNRPAQVTSTLEGVGTGTAGIGLVGTSSFGVAANGNDGLVITKLV